MQHERDALKRFYGKSWHDRIDKMSAGQVLAIFRKFKLEGKIK
jgi:hypothetical protein